MSILSPKTALAITEHSICHPGRPGPQGEDHEGSPGFERFHKAKSEGDLRPIPIDKAPDNKNNPLIKPQENACSRRTLPFFKQLSIPSTPWFNLCIEMTLGFIE